LVFAGAKLAALDVVPGVAGSSATELPPEPRPQDGLEDSGDGSEGSGDDAFELPDSLEMTGLPAAFGFCAFASLSLLVMFYFKEHLVFGVTAGFCFGCALCISDLGRRLLPSCLGRWVQRGLILPLLGPVTVAELASLPLALLLVACFLLYRGSHFGFIFQDVLGMAFLLCFQLHAKFTDLRSACYFLCIMFCYDFFWVFLSPLLFDKSVMANVAGGDGDGAGGDASEQLPMVLLLPMFNDPFGGEEMLGFGDVALPGLLVSYTLRQDLLRGRTSGGYFGPCLLGYLIGASLTQVVMSTFQTAQPALIYIVPCTLGTTVLLAWRRRELSALWKGSKPGDIEEPLLPDH
jgi:signal peptide peptidase-like protein 2B